ncbi:MAG: LuxR C-terminal-related transcriptional regulator [Oscillospiraceae bacterium]
MTEPNISSAEFAKVISFLENMQAPPEFFRSNMLVMLDKYFDYSVSSFWLVDEKLGMHDPVSYNLDHRIIRNYQDYYYQFDPFHPNFVASSQAGTKAVLTLDDIPYTHYPMKEDAANPYFSYLSDWFTLSQEVILSFNVGKQQYGSIALFSKKSNKADGESAISALNIVTPFIAQLLYQSLQLLNIKFRTNMLESVVNGLEDGIIMFDCSGTVLYYNSQAFHCCREIMGNDIGGELLQQFINAFLLRSCSYTGNGNISALELPNGYHAQFVFSREDGQSVCTTRISRRVQNDVAPLALPGCLSVREGEIVVLISQGKTNKEIADLLYISIPTVKTHISNIFQKIGVSNRTSLMNKLCLPA